MSSSAATNSVYLKASSVTAWQTASMLRMKKTVVNRQDISPEAHLYARYGNSCFRFISTCAQTCCSIYMYMYMCMYLHADSHVRCENGIYVSAAHRCDGWVDCVDGIADERHCACTPRQFVCANSR